MLRRALIAASVALLAAGIAVPAFAWDVEADRVVDQLAYERLTPSARSRVDAILQASPSLDGCPTARLDDAHDLEWAFAANMRSSADLYKAFR